MTKKVFTIGFAIMTTLLVLVLLWQFRVIGVYLLISLTLAAAVRPLIKRLPRRGVVRIAWIVIYVVVLVGFGFFLTKTVDAAINQLQQMGTNMSAQDQWKLPAWLQGTSFQETVVSQLPPPGKLFDAIVGDQGQFVLPALLGFTLGMLDLITSSLVTLFLSVYWIVNQIHFERLWLSLLPSEQRKQARDIWRTVEPDLGAYIRSQVLHSLMAGLLLGLGYWALGSPYPALLALVGALACLIPMVGPALALILPLLVGLLTSVELSVFTVLYTLAILAALAIWVKPRLFDRRWDNPILTLVLLIAMGSAFGLIGIIIAPPLSAVCQILWSLLVSHRMATGLAIEVSDLKARQEHIWVSIKAMDELPMPLITSTMERLTQLIAKAEPILQTAVPVEASVPGLTNTLQPEQEEGTDRVQDR